MNLDKKTNYNKRFRLTRQSRLRLCPLGEAAWSGWTGWAIGEHG
jgi:hypothetical protein